METKADWLRSEIEKLEGEIHKCPDTVKFGCRAPETRAHGIRYSGHNDALTSIITRYKEELKVLESKK